ncbi:MAG TPA: alkaline phosphatase family protein [Thermodesulfobacteriota bacterium]|nr:alkaline phosphatase family protein [Thermodesulfobacteriota bacterium]
MRAILSILFILSAAGFFISCERTGDTAPSRTEPPPLATDGPSAKQPRPTLRPDGGNPENVPPRLVVGIVVDQMRYDFLTRFWDEYGDDGFKRLVGEGFSFGNARLDYVPTTTCPGHASIYTGAPPSVHGIIGNDWFDRDLGGEIYCAYDKTASLVGGGEGLGKVTGMRSPRKMLTTTVTDEIKLASGMQSIVIGISEKDRAAIMPAGHLGDAAYWLDAASGEWVTSTYYYRNDKNGEAPELPAWVKNFNSENSAEKYLARPGIDGEWNTLLDISEYEESADDGSPYEKSISGKDEATGEYRKPVFPYVLKDVLAQNPADTGGMYGRLITATPFGNSLTKDFAVAAVEGAGLGKDGVTDFLAVSFSSTDIIGHYYGPRSVEVEDTYLRLDRDIAALLESLDRLVGEGNYLVFLTADHGVVDVPLSLEDAGVPAGYFTEDDELITMLNAHLAKVYGPAGGKLVLAYSNQQVYLDRDLIRSKLRAGVADVERETADFLLTLPGVADAVTATELRGADFTTGPRALVENGYNMKRSGDVAVVMEPAWIEYKARYGKRGTTHGAPYTYDTHVPLVFYGWKIRRGSSMRPVGITDAAPTVSALLGVPFPNGATGQPLVELFQ